MRVSRPLLNTHAFAPVSSYVPLAHLSIQRGNSRGSQICGAISEYNLAPGDRYGVKVSPYYSSSPSSMSAPINICFPSQNTSLICKKQLSVYGMFVGAHIATLGQRFFAEVPALMMQGKLKARETLTEGLENAADVFVKMLQSGGAEGIGKPVVVVSME